MQEKKKHRNNEVKKGINNINPEIRLDTQFNLNKNIVQYEWNNRLEGFRGNKLFLKYDINLSRIPIHLFNFMFGVLMQDPIVYTGGKIIFSQLTLNEFSNLKEIIKRNYNSFGCAGKKRGYKVKEIPIIEATKIVEDYKPDGNNIIICANGFGKDGINVALLVTELDYNARCFTLKNQYKGRLWKERFNTARRFYKKIKVEYNLVDTSFFKNRDATIGFYPYVVGIPIACYYGSNVILDGIQIHNNKTSILDGSFYCPGETIFTFNNVSRATGIKLSSPLRPLSNFGSQKLLVNRYKEFLPFQRSCMYGKTWCGTCSKCNRKALYLQTLGLNPEMIKLRRYRKENLALDQYGPVQDSVRQIISKIEGLKYKTWVEGANDHVFNLIWEGTNIRNIFQENFEIYNKDPGPDGEGYTLNPSRWGELLI